MDGHVGRSSKLPALGAGRDPKTGGFPVSTPVILGSRHQRAFAASLSDG
jgi:hypothetical protein